MRRARRHHVVVAAAVLVAASGGWVAGAGGAKAAITSATPTPATVAAAADFATATYGDAWDFANGEDFDKSLESWMVGASNVTRQNGMLSFDMGRMGQLPLVRGFGEIAIPWGRDGSLNTIPAATYTKLSFRMNAQISQITTGQVVWMNCGNFIAACHGGQPITIKPGWNTYDITLQNQYSDLPAAWTGQIHSLVVVPVGANLSTGHIDLDWARLYQPAATVAVDLVDNNPGGVITASWSATPTPTDYADAANRSALFATATSSATTRVNFNAAAFPPGTYRFFGTDSDGSTSPLGSPLTITARAGVARLLAEVNAGTDYAGAVRGDAWDFAQSSDVAKIDNATVTFDGQYVHGRNAGPRMNDSSVELSVGPPIDGQRYTRFSMRIHYDGGFRLTDDDGGGMNGRLYWGPTGPSDAQVSQDFLVYPGWNVITFDLTWPKLHDEGQSPATKRLWGSDPIRWFRIDPNEDRGERTWAIDWVRLGGTSPFGSFDGASRVAGGIAVGGWAIDPDVAGPTPVHVYVDNVGFNLGDAAGSRPDVGAAYPAYGSAHGFSAVVTASPGAHNVCAYGINQGPGRNVELGCRRVVVDSMPFGAFDVVTRAAGGISVGGWAIDADTASPTPVHVYVGNVGFNLGDASGARPDVGAVYPSYGSAHGFGAVLPAGPGTHRVCAYGINQGPGANVELGCKTVAVDSVPFGGFDVATRVSDGIHVVGWAIDPDTAAPTPVHVYVDNVGFNLGDASASRSDVGAVYPSWGPNHGFNVVVAASPGPHNVCAYGINQGPGRNVELGCRRVG